MEAKTETKPAQRTQLLRSDAMQRVLAFGALIVLFIFLSLASKSDRSHVVL